MENFSGQYHYWIEKLGWVTPEMLCLLTRGVSRAQLPQGRDRLLERFLSEEVKASRLVSEKIGSHPIYGNAKKGSRGNVYHDLMAAQAVVKLWLALARFPKTLVSPGEFFSGGVPVIPDFGLTVTLSNGVHGFALEYQTYKEAGRTTKTKLLDYWKNFGGIKAFLKSDFLWAVFLLERDELWIAERAAAFSFDFAYFVSAYTFFKTEAIETAPVFFVETGRRASLIQKL